MLTSATFGLSTDVYSTLPSGSGLAVGEVVQFQNIGRLRMLVQYNPSASGALAANAAVKFIGTAGAYVVDEVAAAGDSVLGVNDLAGTTIPVGNYFWITIKGPCFPLLTTTISAGTIVNPGATAGSLSAASATAANQQTNIESLASSGSGGATACWIY